MNTPPLRPNYDLSPEAVMHIAQSAIAIASHRCNMAHDSELGPYSLALLGAVGEQSSEIGDIARGMLEANPPLNMALESFLQYMEGSPGTKGYSFETATHSVRLAALAAKFAQSLMDGGSIDGHSISREDGAILCLAAALHDYGKCLIPTEILHFNGPLLEDSHKQIMRMHVEFSELMTNVLMLGDGARGLQDKLTQIIATHHEDLDGQGYPRGLGAAQLDFMHQVLPVLDRFDAMTADRSYHKGMPVDKAMGTIWNEASAGKVNEAVVAYCEPLMREWLVERGHAGEKVMPSVTLPSIADAGLLGQVLQGYVDESHALGLPADWIRSALSAQKPGNSSLPEH